MKNGLTGVLWACGVKLPFRVITQNGLIHLPCHFLFGCKRDSYICGRDDWKPTQAVAEGHLRAHEEVTVSVLCHLLDALARELGQVPIERQLVVQDLVCLHITNTMGYKTTRS